MEQESWQGFESSTILPDSFSCICFFGDVSGDGNVRRKQRAQIVRIAKSVDKADGKLAMNS